MGKVKLKKVRNLLKFTELMAIANGKQADSFRSLYSQPLVYKTPTASRGRCGHRQSNSKIHIEKLKIYISIDILKRKSY